MIIFSTVNAATNDLWSSIFWGGLEFWEFVLLVISLFVLVAWLLSIIFILWWWLLLILSWWKDDKIRPAINTIRYAVIGVIVTVLTIFLFPIFGRLLGLDVDKYAQPKRIFEKIEEIWNIIFWNKTSNYTSWTWIEWVDDFPDDFSDL